MALPPAPTRTKPAFLALIALLLATIAGLATALMGLQRQTGQAMAVMNAEKARLTSTIISLEAEVVALKSRTVEALPHPQPDQASALVPVIIQPSTPPQLELPVVVASSAPSTRVSPCEQDLAMLGQTTELGPLEAILARLPEDLVDPRLTEARARAEGLRHALADDLARVLDAAVPQPQIPSAPVRLELRQDLDAMTTIGLVVRTDGSVDTFPAEPWPREGAVVRASVATAAVERRYADIVLAYQQARSQRQQAISALRLQADRLQQLDHPGRYAGLVARINALTDTSP